MTITVHTVDLGYGVGYVLGICRAVCDVSCALCAGKFAML